MSNPKLDELSERMASDQYSFTELIHHGTKQTDFGYMGFTITRGLWYKLRVYKCYTNAEGKVTINNPDEYQYLTKAKVMRQLKELSQY